MTRPSTASGWETPGHPQMMKSQGFTSQELRQIERRRATRGMREKWHAGVHGPTTVVRVLPDDLYNFVMHSDEPVEPRAVFKQISERRRQGRRNA